MTSEEDAAGDVAAEAEAWLADQTEPDVDEEPWPRPRRRPPPRDTSLALIIEIAAGALIAAAFLLVVFWR